jgi:hypothetical protein
LSLKIAAALLDAVLDLGEAVEVPIDDRLVDEPPEVLGRLEFGGVGWQVDEPYALGNGQAGLCVPAGTVEQQDDRALFAGAGFLREQGEQALEERLGDAVADIPVALAGRAPRRR